MYRVLSSSTHFYPTPATYPHLVLPNLFKPVIFVANAILFFENLSVDSSGTLITLELFCFALLCFLLLSFVLFGLFFVFIRLRRKQRVIELGGGTGALSAGLARAGADSVTCTDLPCHLARIESTIRSNARTGRERSRAFRSEKGRGSGSSDVMGADANHGKLPAAPPAAPPVVVVKGEARVRVAALRWGEGEDLARVRARVDSEGGSGEMIDATGDGSDRSSSVCCNASALFQTSVYQACNVGETTAVAPRNNHISNDDSSSSSTCKSSNSAAQETETAVSDISDARGMSRRESGGDAREMEAEAEGSSSSPSSAFDVIVLSEVLYWPALDLLQEDTREPLRRTLVGLSKPGTKVILIYKER